MYDQQLGVKKSWSDWMSRREDEKAHINTLRRSKSYVKMSIDAHQKRLDTMAQIFNPTRIKEIQDSFKKMQLERENRGIIQRLSMIANERTVITKTNDPKERRWENKLRNDKRRMLYADKQAKLRAINFAAQDDAKDDGKSV